MELERLFLQISNIVKKDILKQKFGSDHNCECINITLGQSHYLEAIFEMENPTLSSIAEKLNVSKPSTSIVLNKLIENGFLVKEQSADDKRVYYIRITDKARCLKDAEVRGFQNIVNKIREQLPAEEVGKIEKTLEKVIKCFD